MKTYTHPVYPYVRPAELGGATRRWPVVVVGAGPVGLTAAIDLARRGVEVLLVDEGDTVSTGSRAICWSKRTLEIFDRLGCAERLVQKGVGWNVGRVFFRDEQVYEFNLLPGEGHRRPAFINLQQYWVEQFLVERLGELERAELRWRSKLAGVVQEADRVALRIGTPDGEYVVHADWVIAADGARSPTGSMLGLECEGQVFHDRFLIADIQMTSGFPVERRFWFDPPFHRNQSALLHRQADDVWRVDFQLGWDADPDDEKRPERIVPRIRAMLGDDAQFEIEWASVYTFQCRRMGSFRHGRVLFAGDAAHLLSPFGARGANSGVQDADNLAWKLELVLSGNAPERLLDSYDSERTYAADENIRHSTRSTDFITPKSHVSRIFRDAVLGLAKRYPFARALVNSGRLSLPATLSESSLNTRDAGGIFGGPAPGAVAVDAPVAGPRGGWLLGYLDGGFTLLCFGPVVPADAARSLARDAIACAIVQIGARADDACVIEDTEGLVAARYDGSGGTCYLFRPDQHVCARWPRFDLGAVRAAIARATAQPAHAKAAKAAA